MAIEGSTGALLQDSGNSKSLDKMRLRLSNHGNLQNRTPTVRSAIFTSIVVGSWDRQ